MTYEESFKSLAAVWRELSTGAGLQSLLAAVEYATPDIFEATSAPSPIAAGPEVGAWLPAPAR